MYGYVWICMDMYGYVWICMDVYVYGVYGVYGRMYVCTYARMYTYIYICMYTGVYIYLDRPTLDTIYTYKGVSVSGGKNRLPS